MLEAPFLQTQERDERSVHTSLKEQGLEFFPSSCLSAQDIESILVPQSFC